MKTQFIMQFVTILAPNFSEAMLTISTIVDKKKDEAVNLVNDVFNK